MSVTRRNFLQVAGVTGMLGALAACDTTTPETPSGTDEGSGAEPTPQSGDEPAGDDTGAESHDLSEYPLDPDDSDVEAKYEKTEMAGYNVYQNEDGAKVSVADDSKIIQVDGYAFKDLNGNGKLDIYEDWRLSAEDRAHDLAAQMDIHYALRQLNSGSFRGGMGWGQAAEETDDAEIVPENEKTDIDEGYTNRINMQFSQDPSSYNRHYNEMQAYAESKNYGVPVLYECETMNVGGLSWPQNNTLAASFKPENAIFAGRGISCILRGAYGANKANSPQSDVGTEPTWDRNSGTFCGDPALARDMANGYITGMQSTWSDDGSEDLGWGKESMCCNMKHFPGDGAAQYGRNSHTWDGAYDVYPNRNFKANWVPFIDGGLHLDSKTEQVASFMPFYSIGYSDDEEWGENVGGGFSEYIMNVGRAYGFKGMYSSDWGIVEQRPWGVWDLTFAERVAKTFEAGMNLLIDDLEYDYIDDAYDIMVEDMGQDEADAMIRDRVEHIHRLTFLMGMFDDPYLDKDRAKELYDNPEWVEGAKRCCLEGIVMLKNKGGVIKEGGIGKGAKVYVPEAAAGGMSWFGGQTTTEDNTKVNLPFADDLLADYDLVTDSKDAEGNTIDATASDLTGVEFAIIKVNGPNQPSFGTGFSGPVETDENYNTIFHPRTLQYREYVATEADGVAPESIAGGQVIDVEKDAPTNLTENWSPLGNSVTASNEDELDKVIRIKNDLPADAKLILCVSAGQPCMCFHELEPYGDVIFWAQQNQDDYFMDIINGDFEPFGLMPWQLPKDMKDVNTQSTDTPRDMECYTDSEGNTYDFGFGLNWSGVIQDERTEKYCVAPLLEPESEIVEEGLI